MQRRWREAAARGQLPDLGMLPVPQRAAGQWVRARIDTTAASRPAATSIPQNAGAEVRAVAPAGMASYRGALIVTTASEGRVAGTFADQRPFEILYRLPRQRSLPGVSQGSPHQLEYREAVVDESLRRDVFLSDSAGPILLYVTDGARTPYRRAIGKLQLVLQQNPPSGDRTGAGAGCSSVTVSYRGSRLTLFPGESRGIAGVGGPVRFYLVSSWWRPQDAGQEAEGDPYHVMVLVYRPG